MYALLDWDNTLRRGATLFAWMDFLCEEKHVLSRKIIDNRLEIGRRCRAGEISHDTLCGLCTLNYVEGVRGMKEEDYKRYVKEFLEWDKGLDIPSNTALLDFLRRHDIPIIIASGSPYNLIRDMCEEMGVIKAFCFTEDVENGVLTGTASDDAGGNKQLAVDYGFERFGEPPLLAAGDSSSDFPMLDAAKIRVVIGDKREMAERYPDAIFVDLSAEGAAHLEESLAKIEKEMGL